MSYCKKEGKDQIVFLTEEDAKTPSATPFSLPEDEDDAPGLILPNGDINWGCPCLGGMATGPCGVEFREAFSCFHYSKAESKGSDCYDSFKIMQDCMAQYPSLYGKEEPKTEDLEDTEEVTEKDSKEPTVPSSSNNSSPTLQRDSTS